jgi:predicted membrane protein
LLAAGFAIAGTLLIYPRVLGAQMGPWQHTALPIMLFGVCAAFVHGFGFRPESTLPRIIFGRVAAWLFMAAGIGLLMLR